MILADTKSCRDTSSLLKTHLLTITQLLHPASSNHQCTIPSGTSAYNVEVLTLVAKFTVIPIAVFIELLISVYTVKNNYLKRQKCVGCRCSSLKHLVQTLALYGIF